MTSLAISEIFPPMFLSHPAQRKRSESSRFGDSDLVLYGKPRPYLTHRHGARWVGFRRVIERHDWLMKPALDRAVPHQIV
jgi:hypothetical protein